MKARKFWKESLRDTYTKFVLPTGNDAPIITRKSAWTHHMHNSAQGRVTNDRELWGLLEPSGTAPIGISYKRLKTQESVPHQIQDAHESIPEKRKSALFSRKIDLNGKIRSYKVRMYPTLDQRKILQMWYAASNRAYNAAVSVVKNMRTKANLIKVRKEIVPNQTVPEKEREWVTKVPSAVRASAVKQCIDAQHTNLKQRGFGRFKMRFRSYKKDPTGVIVLEKAYPQYKLTGPVHSFSMYRGEMSSAGSSQKKYGLMHMAPKAFAGVENAILIRDRHWLIDKLVTDGKLMEAGKILWDKRTNRWHLAVLIDHEVKKKDDENSPPKGIVSLDPGVRTFNTLYSADGTHGSLLVDALKVMKDMCKTMDKIRSNMDKTKDQHKASLDVMSRQRGVPRYYGSKPISMTYHNYRRSLRHMKDRYHKVSSKLRNWRNNAHYDAINFLLERYDAVLIPEFQTKKMAAKAKRNIHSTVVRCMYTWSHYMFRTRLASKAELDDNKIIRLIGEPGTSKTCGRCGYWNSDLRGKKMFECPSCGIVIDRDVNGARNNMIALLQ